MKTVTDEGNCIEEMNIVRFVRKRRLQSAVNKFFYRLLTVILCGTALISDFTTFMLVISSRNDFHTQSSPSLYSFWPIAAVSANADAKRLFNDLLDPLRYNAVIRPVSNVSDKLTVKLGLRLTQLIDVVSEI